MRNGIVKGCGVRSGDLFSMIIRMKQQQLHYSCEANVLSKHNLEVWHER